MSSSVDPSPVDTHTLSVIPTCFTAPIEKWDLFKTKKIMPLSPPFAAHFPCIVPPLTLPSTVTDLLPEKVCNSIMPQDVLIDAINQYYERNDQHLYMYSEWRYSTSKSFASTMNSTRNNSRNNSTTGKDSIQVYHFSLILMIWDNCIYFLQYLINNIQLSACQRISLKFSITGPCNCLSNSLSLSLTL